MSFTPTPAMIEAAETLFFAMARLSLIEPIVLNYQRLILSEGQWSVKPAFVEKGMPAEVVLEPDRSFLLSEEDFATYDGLCQKAQVMAGLEVKEDFNCPLLEAKSALVEAQHQLAFTMSSVTGHSLDQVLMLPQESYLKYVDLSLRLLAPFADPHKRYGIPKPTPSPEAAA